MQRTVAGAVSGTCAGGVPAERFARLYDALFPALYGYIRFRVGDRHVAEDLTAQVFERALGRLASVRQPEHIRAWLFTVARRAIADHYRRRRPVAPLDSVEALAHLWVDSPEVEAVRRDDRRRLAAYLAGLSEREREILGLKFVAGLTNRDIAGVLDLSESNVAQIIHRAIVKLRAQFVQEETR